MGYRSNVAYVIVFPSDAQYHMFLTTARTLSNQPIVNDEIEHVNGQKVWGDMVRALDETMHGVDIYKNGYLTIDGDCYTFPAIAFKAESVKWYESYEDVHSHESLLALADLFSRGELAEYQVGNRNTTQRMNPCTYNFLRIGEDEDDIERRDNGRHVAMTTHPMMVNRRITFDEPMRNIFGKEDV
jgi:hypothetical protein